MSFRSATPNLDYSAPSWNIPLRWKQAGRNGPTDAHAATIVRPSLDVVRELLSLRPAA